jgi:predicted transcriptional regulator of viral defense system
MAGKLQRALFEIAEDNYGYVTTSQATEIGVPRRGLADLTRLGAMHRVAYGVYRIVDFPATELDSYFEATLWPQGVRGILSHESALDLWDLCDVNPAKVHVTVPRAHRVRRQVPALYVLHNDDLEPEDLDSFEGIPITTVERTLHDCIDGGTRHDLLKQAIANAVERRAITAATADDLRHALASRDRQR